MKHRIVEFKTCDNNSVMASLEELTCTEIEIQSSHEMEADNIDSGFNCT